MAIDREISDDRSLKASIGAELASLQGVAHLSELLRIARRLNVFTGRRYKESRRMVFRRSPALSDKINPALYVYLGIA